VTVAVRLATAADADAVTDVYLASRAAALPWLPTVHTDADTRDWIEHVLLARCRMWVATDGDDVVGLAALSPGHLEQLYLHPDRRREGIGTLLLRQVQEASPDGFTLVVFARNTAARAFYERAGCRVIGTSDGSGNEECEPDVTYEWTP
jgi:ribosomal protein S18 acetylase RimI-like enzyme